MIPEKILLSCDWMNSRILLNYWTIFLVLLTAGSFVPFSDIIHNLFMIDTIFHLLICAALSLISMILFKSRKTAFLLSFAVTPYGYLLEMVHASVYGESFNALNAMANNAGVLTGITAGFVLRLKNHYIRTDIGEGRPEN
jgi:hypothetical protein